MAVLKIKGKTSATISDVTQKNTGRASRAIGHRFMSSLEEMQEQARAGVLDLMSNDEIGDVIADVRKAKKK